MANLAARTGRRYHLVDYTGHPEAERVVVVMGSAAETVARDRHAPLGSGERVGVVQVRLYRPFPAEALLAALPPTAKRITVLDRTKEPGSIGEPLFLDVVGALVEAHAERRAGSHAARHRWPVRPRVERAHARHGRRCVRRAGAASNRVAGSPSASTTTSPALSLSYDASFDIEPTETLRAVFFGLGADGTVGANKNTIKILGSEEGLYAQGYFVYDSKKSGSQTVSHLRFGPQPIRAPYLVEQASFVGCHHFGLLDRAEVLGRAAHGATLLLNSPHPPGRALGRALAPGPGADPRQGDRAVRDRRRPDRSRGRARPDGSTRAADLLLRHLRRAAARRGDRPDQGGDRQELRPARPERRPSEPPAVDHALEGLQRVELPAPGDVHHASPAADRACARARSSSSRSPPTMMAGPRRRAAGQRPAGRRHLAERDGRLREAQDLRAGRRAGIHDLCIQCGNCSFVCPHSVIRSKYYDRSQLVGAPAGFRSAPLRRRRAARHALHAAGLRGRLHRLRALRRGLPDRRTGRSRPARRSTSPPREPAASAERQNIAFFETLPVAERSRVDFGTVRGTQFLQPLFEFSGACAGCGETPYLKLLSQLFGDRAVIANATGCSSIYGGNLPTTPWTTDAEGRGPAWSNSLFEDNAEFGLGFRLAADRHVELARRRLAELRDALGAELVERGPRRAAAVGIGAARTARASGRAEEAARARWTAPVAVDLASVADHLVRGASGSSAATAGPTTSASAGSTMSLPAGTT